MSGVRTTQLRGAAVTSEDVENLINHVALPPQLPQSEDNGLSRIQGNMLSLAQDAIASMNNASSPAWTSTSDMLTKMDTGDKPANIRHYTLKQKLAQLGHGCCFALCIDNHNCGILLLRKEPETVTIESFELAATNTSIMSTAGRLRRTFPGRAVVCSSACFFRASFQDQFLIALERLATEPPPDHYHPTTKKAGSSLHEERDTMHPGFINDYLMSILSAVGQDCEFPVSQKCVRDDVLWEDTLDPWRRSPFWLFLKISVLRTLLISLDPEEAQKQFKSFMIHVVTRLLDLSSDARVNPDLLSVVHTKLARRVSKFENEFGTISIPHVSETSQRACQLLADTWTAHTENHDSIRTLPVDGWEDATSLSLIQTRKHLAEVLRPLHGSSQSPSFSPGVLPRVLQNPGFLPSLESASKKNPIILLADIELWVKDHLAAWTMLMLDMQTVNACDQLASLVENYWQLASPEYRCSPREESEALLTVMELWVALDKICVARIPLLEGYPPEMPEELLAPLLLPKEEDMRRLHTVEAYIKNRWSRVARGASSVFKTPENTSFCVKYFDSSLQLQQLRKIIEKSDEEVKRNKIVELDADMKTYNKLLADARDQEHEEHWTRHGKRHNMNRCGKCMKETNANNMRIARAEKSLPDNIVQLKAAVFELQPPTEFAAWRDITWLIINDIGQRKSGSTAKSHGNVQTYDQLRRHSKCRSRITLGSSAKSHVGSHYRSEKLPSTIEAIYVNNGLRYDVYDKTQGKWLTWPSEPPSFKTYCTLSLPPGPYANLAWSLRTNKHTTNEALCKRSTCDGRLEIKEFDAFSQLRAGQRIQWLNILRELGCSNLDHTHPAVCALILQAAWEAGTASDDYLRKTHFHMKDHAFCSKLLTMLERRLDVIESNWDKQYSMMMLVQISLRLLTLSSDPDIESGCLKLLRRARKVSLEWCHQLQVHMRSISTQEDIQREGAIRLLTAALLCFSTFDVDEKHLASVLHSAEDLSMMAEAQALVCDNKPSSSAALPMLLQQSLLRQGKIAHAIEQQVRVCLENHGDGLNDAIQKLWDGVQLQPNWHPVSSQTPWWVFNRTTPSHGTAQMVHYNLLTGDLLVSGKALGKISDNIKAVPLFKQLFGSAILHVFGSSMPGMDYRVSQLIHGNEIHIGMRNGEVVIKACSDDTVFQALPRNTLDGALPVHFIQSFHHWLDETTGVIDFRPLNRPWQKSDRDWKLEFSSLDFSGATAQMRLGSRRLVDLESPVGIPITNILRVLDDASRCHIVFDETHPSELEVDLPRYNLHFVVTPAGKLLSLEFNAIVDENQSIGTLIGLQNKLILRDVKPIGHQYERRMIVPYGKVAIRKNRDHVSVIVMDGGDTKRRFFVYNLDRHLRKLRGAQDILGLLHNAYLHAVTSFPLPDPFTGRTGTEEAIGILKGASLFTTSPLTEEEVSTLEAIAALTPIREYYPAHIQAMQKVTWNSSLSSFAQHDDYILAAEAILTHHASTGRLFGQEASNEVSFLREQNLLLLERARIRNASVIRSGLFSDVTASVLRDCRYTGRDESNQNPQAAQTYEIAKLIQEWPSQVSTHRDLATTLGAWDNVSGYHVPFDMKTATMQDLTNFDISAHWGSFYENCRTSSKHSERDVLMFTLGAIALGAEAKDLIHIRTLSAFAFSEAFRDIHPPPTVRSYTLSDGSRPSNGDISGAVRKNTTSIDLPDSASREQYEEYRRQETALDAQVRQFSQHIQSQWPAARLTVPPGDYSHIHIKSARKDCQKLFDKWHKNRSFLEHIRSVNSELLKMQSEHVKRPIPKIATKHHDRSYSRYRYPSLERLLQDDQRANAVQLDGVPSPLSRQPRANRGDVTRLEDLEADICSNADLTHSRYGEALHASVEAFSRQQFDDESYEPEIHTEHLLTHYEDCCRRLNDILGLIRRALAPNTAVEVLIDAAGLWPRLSESCLLSQLSTTRIAGLGPCWKSILLNMGESIAFLQRSERMLKFHDFKSHRSLWKELKNPGREGWSKNAYPSWLLLEIENNITIRPLQAKVAREMMAPNSNSNSVLQLNMGEGKSSVIIRMLVAALADGKRLIRVVVLRPLLRQTEQVLSSRLGGILDQRVHHAPFSRKTKVDRETIETISLTYTDCRQQRGVAIILPEEILSMRLMTREKMVSDPSLAASLLDLQRSLEGSCRDVIDESDKILDIRSQLIYPVGTQQMLDGGGDRWLIMQAILRQVKFRATRLAKTHPSELEIDYNGKQFPVLKFLCSEVSTLLLQQLVEDVIDSRIAGLTFNHYTNEVRSAIRNFIGLREVSKEDKALISEKCTSSLHWKVLLVLRGLFAHGVLQFTLERKRWLVEYGLDLKRCLMAVPYRAKGVPSQNSEFGHPDVALILTVQSYYYTGLTNEQVEVCFKLLLKDSNAQDIYHGWASSCQDLPENLASFEAINLDDRTLCERTLFPLMQFNLETIDFYLNQVVFPKEGKEFAKRLSASGWDIPSAAGKKALLTTGFSGTNDSRDILPFSIKQQDLEELHHTNAMVLDLILRDENRAYIHCGGSNGKKLSIEELLSVMSLQSPRINVMIDVGAQVLEATNLQFARAWLDKETHAKAAVYFNDRDEPMVLDRNGLTTPLRISPFCNKLDGCLIYLDEVHTRGIDLAIPLGARAAVTLGPRLVKDRLVQACMRLRNLGNGHSLCFMAPTEVHRSICNLKGYDDSYQLGSKDVLAWCMEQTCQALDVARPLRAMHGLEYLRQQKVLRKYLPPNANSSSLAKDKGRMERFWEAIQEDDSLSLELLYGVHEERVGAFQRLLDRDSEDPMMEFLVGEHDSMSKLVLEDSTMDNEQERELEHEIERQQQVQRPRPAEPRKPGISKGLRSYVKTGSRGDLEIISSYRAFELFQATTAGLILRGTTLESEYFDVFMTEDFGLVMVLGQGINFIDGHIPPTNWVLSSSEHDSLLVISAHEANELLLEIKASDKVRLHIYAPRLSKGTALFSRMDFYTPNSTPSDRPCSSEAVRDLGLFAGSLYLENETEYEALSHFLGIVTRSRRAGNKPIDSDGFVKPDIRREIGWPENCPFAQSPLVFLKEVFALRMNGQGFAATHMGYLLDGRALRDDAFDGCGGRESRDGEDGGVSLSLR